MLSRRQFTILPLCAAGLAALGTAARAADSRPQDWGLVQPGKLMVATQGTFAPFSMRLPNGKLDGLEIRVGTEIARRLGLDYVPVITQFDAVLVGLMAGQYDMTSVSMDITPARQKQVLFADGWLESGAKIITTPKSGIKTGEDLKGKNVGAVAASTFGKIAEQFGANLKNYKAEVDAIQDMLNGNLDAVVTDAVAASYEIKSEKLPLVTPEGTLSHIQKGLAFEKSRASLVRAVNDALSGMIADGTYAKLTTPLIGFDPHPQEPIRSELS